MAARHTRYNCVRRGILKAELGNFSFSVNLGLSPLHDRKAMDSVWRRRVNSEESSNIRNDLHATKYEQSAEEHKEEHVL